MEKLRTIRLYGKLGQLFGREYRLAVANAAEAVRALGVMVPGFKAYMSNQQAKYAVFLGKENIGADQLHHPTGQADIRIAPVPAGSKKLGVFQIILGIVLIVAGFFTGGQTWGPAMMVLGAGMVISGAILMLSPQSTGSAAADGPNNRPSYAFNGPVNTAAQGNPVPLAYGEVIVGSCVISGGIYAEDRA